MAVTTLMPGMVRDRMSSSRPANGILLRCAAESTAASTIITRYEVLINRKYMSTGHATNPSTAATAVRSGSIQSTAHTPHGSQLERIGRGLSGGSRGARIRSQSFVPHRSQFRERHGRPFRQSGASIRHERG